jgi:hypothetical protein
LDFMDKVIIRMAKNVEARDMSFYQLQTLIDPH